MDALQEKVNLLVKEWHEGVLFHSGYCHMQKHPNYQKLLDLGTDSVPCILRIMKYEGNYWIALSFLLCDITNEKPEYEPEYEGGFGKFNVKDLANAWIDWGIKRGLIDE